MEAGPISPKWTRKTLSSPEEPRKITSAPLRSKCERVKERKAHSPSLPPPSSCTSSASLFLTRFLLPLPDSPLPSLFPFFFPNSPSLPPTISLIFPLLFQCLLSTSSLLFHALKIHLSGSRLIPLALCFPVAVSMLSSIHQERPQLALECLQQLCLVSPGSRT